MDTSRQVLRWAIPGWLYEVVLLSFIGIHFVIVGNTLTLSQFVRGDYGSLFAFLTVITGLGVPVGFLVSQMYFFLYWLVPVPLLKTPQDRGYTILRDCEYDFARMFGRDLDREAHCEKGRVVRIGPLQTTVKTRKILRRYQHNWTLVDSAWYWSLRISPLPGVQAHADFLGDMYLTLGTSLTAGCLAYLTYILYEVFMHPGMLLQGIAPWVAFGVNGLLLVILVGMLRVTRHDTLCALERLKHDLITAVSRSSRKGKCGCPCSTRVTEQRKWGKEHEADGDA